MRVLIFVSKRNENVEAARGGGNQTNRHIEAPEQHDERQDTRFNAKPQPRLSQVIMDKILPIMLEQDTNLGNYCVGYPCMCACACGIYTFSTRNSQTQIEPNF